ncbi:hypothetical protein A6R68_07700 [Neotoma lepida]|uniref:Uncharacterized protein n=1 Tax=Neotoma lepida TaxID=56216 RepID=A0A1A6GDC1_NEOLE|nr:hypothetical protein A6R68_07700 [Neotoma lepida]
MKDAPRIKNSEPVCEGAFATWAQAAKLRVAVAQRPPPVRSLEEDPKPRRRQGVLGPCGQALEPRGDTPWQRPDLGPQALACEGKLRPCPSCGPAHRRPLSCWRHQPPASRRWWKATRPVPATRSPMVPNSDTRIRKPGL